MRKSIVAALFAVLTVTPALAEVPKKADKPIVPAKQEAPTWPLPWKPGAKLVYDERSETVERKDGKTERMASTATATISAVRADGDGVVQRWQWSDYHYTFENIDATTEAVVRGLADALGNVPLDVRLDKDGNFAAVLNAAAFQPVIREHLGNSFRAGVVKAAADAQEKPTPEALAKLDTQLAPMLDMMSSEAFVTTLLSKEPQAFNFMGAGGITLNEEIEYDDQGQNPVGGEPIPMIGRLKVSPAQQQGFVEVHWTLDMDPERAAAIIGDVAQKLLGEKAEASDKAALSKAMPKTVDIGTNTTFLIDTATGIVHRMVRVERKNIGDKQESESTTLVLRKQ